MDFNSVTPQQFKEALTDELARSKDKLREDVKNLSNKELQRIVLTFIGVFHNEITLSEKEQKFVEDSVQALENFIGIQQANGELPKSED